jgi:hypothetical protein
MQQSPPSAQLPAPRTPLAQPAARERWRGREGEER